MRGASINNAAVVRVTKVHPFRLWLLQSGRKQRDAADALGVSVPWLSQVLQGRVAPTRELYRDMARVSKGAVTLKELLAFKEPSGRPRRRDMRRRQPRVARPSDFAPGTKTVQ